MTGGCLRLAQPFVSGWLDLYREGHDPVAACLAAAAAGAPAPAAPRWTDLLDKHLRPEYYVTQKHRLGDLSGVFNATGSRGAGGYTADDDPPTAAPPLLLAVRLGRHCVVRVLRGGVSSRAAARSRGWLGGVGRLQV